MVYISLAFSILTACISCVFFFAWRKAQRTINRMESHGLTVDDMTREDLQIIREQPMTVQIGTYTLVIDAFSISEYEIFIKRFTSLVLRYRDQVFFQDFVELAALSDNDALKKKASELEASIGNRQIMREINRIIYHVLLKKNGVSLRYFRGHATRLDVLKIFYGIQAYNIDAVKKNIIFLLRELGQTSESADSSKPSAKRTAGLSKKPVQDPYPWYSSYSVDERKLAQSVNAT